jgi:Ca2+/H+ antiporter, TMEM165/GDT1 family
MNLVAESTLLIAVAEMGDKTQLLSLCLAARFRTFWPVAAGVLVATLANHALVAAFGQELAQWVSTDTLRLGVSLLFILTGLWVLVPDKADDAMATHPARRGAFLTSLTAFFLAEMGDKTQLATLTLAARHHQAWEWVTLGTTLGMLLANVPVLYLGEKLLERVPLKPIRYVASAAFIGLGAWGLLSA